MPIFNCVPHPITVHLGFFGVRLTLLTLASACVYLTALTGEAYITCLHIKTDKKKTQNEKTLLAGRLHGTIIIKKESKLAEEASPGACNTEAGPRMGFKAQSCWKTFLPPPPPALQRVSLLSEHQRG